MDLSLGRKPTKIKLVKEKCWIIEVDCGDYDSCITTSILNREEALLSALAIGGVSVEIQEGNQYYNNLDLSTHLPREKQCT